MVVALTGVGARRFVLAFRLLRRWAPSKAVNEKPRSKDDKDYPPRGAATAA